MLFLPVFYQSLFSAPLALRESQVSVLFHLIVRDLLIFSVFKMYSEDMQILMTNFNVK